MHTEDPAIGVPTKSSIERVYIREIIHFSESDSGTRIKLANGKTINSISHLKLFENAVAQYSFFKVNKFCLVNLYHIRNLQRGTDQLNLSDQSTIEIAPKRKTEIKRMLFSCPLIHLVKKAEDKRELKKMAS